MSRLLQMYNTHQKENGGKSLLTKALDSSPGSAEALVPEKLREIITNTIVRLSPILALVESVFDSQKVHEFNRITSLPRQGGAQGEGAVTPTRNAVYVRAGTTLKVIRRKGAVTGFLQDASEKQIDALAAEMENHLLSHVYDLDFYTLWGNELSNAFEYGGWDRFISSFRQTRQNPGTQVPTDTKILDELIDNNTRKQGSQHRKAFLMSPEMLSHLSRLEAQFRLNTDIKPKMGEIAVPGGWRMPTFRGIPIVETTATAPVKTMTTVTATDFTTGGSLPDDEYFFVVTPITYEGEQAASAQASATVSGGSGNGRVDLTFAEDTEALSYKVYFGLVSGVTGLQLHKEVPADTFDGIGTITGRTTTIVIDTASPDSSIPTGMQDDRPLQFINSVPQETIWLIDLDRFQGMGELAYTNKAGDRFGGLVTIKPLAEVDDNTPFLIKSYPALIDAFEATSGVIRGVRVA